ncbi:hypothetical protein SAMN04487934_103129 [Eubacterium ruminantium]|nr:hypothetical protein SAMN04487934_103129 [Eubacterium ruminantium]
MGIFGKMLGSLGDDNSKVTPLNNLDTEKSVGKTVIENVAKENAGNEKAAVSENTLSPQELATLSDKVLATAALSVYCAACDGNISIEEMMEMDINIGAIKGKHKLPESVEAQIKKICDNHEITWEEVTYYLDKMDTSTLMSMSDDLADIMVASDGVNEAEQKCVEQFANYVKSRV